MLAHNLYPHVVIKPPINFLLNTTCSIDTDSSLGYIRQSPLTDMPRWWLWLHCWQLCADPGKFKIVWPQFVDIGQHTTKDQTWTQVDAPWWHEDLWCKFARTSAGPVERSCGVVPALALAVAWLVPLPTMQIEMNVCVFHRISVLNRFR